MGKRLHQGALPSEAPWTRINVIVGKQNAMDAFIIRAPLKRATYLGWGNFHYSEQESKWEEVKASASATPSFKHFYFVHNLECIVAALSVFGPDDGLSLHRVQFRKGETRTLEVVSYNYETYEFVARFSREGEESTVLEFR